MDNSNKKEDVEPWSRGKNLSKAKTYLKLQLESPNNWIQQMIARDPAVSSKTIDRIHASHELFRQYKKENFRSNFRSLKKTMDKNAAAVAFDQNAFEKEASKYPSEPMLKAGYPRWNYSQNNAKKLLENDMKPGGVYSNNMKPLTLRAFRPEYQAFPKKVFGDRLYREHRRKTETSFWVHKRNKKMRKRTIENDMEALIIHEASEVILLEN